MHVGAQSLTGRRMDDTGLGGKIWADLAKRSQTMPPPWPEVIDRKRLNLRKTKAGQEGVLRSSRNPFLVNVNFLVFDWPTRIPSETPRAGGYDRVLNWRGTVRRIRGRATGCMPLNHALAYNVRRGE
jgi:hypothetical protein